MMTAKLFCRALKFAAHASGVKDLRYYLNGVRLEWKDDTLRFIATDGSRLAVAEVRTDVMGPLDPVEMTVTNADVKRVLSVLSKDKGDVSLTITNATGNTPAAGVLMGAGLAIPLTCTGGVYPDWRRVVPPARRESAPMPDGVSCALLAEALTALGALDGSKWPGAVIKAGPGPADVLLIRSCKPNPELLDYFVVVCPLRA